MYIILAVLIGAVIGFIRRGSIRAILEHPYKNWVFAAVGLTLLALIHLYCLLPPIPDFATYMPIGSFVAYLLIFITLIYNLDDIYTIIMAIGITLNFVVTFINGGLMPVSTSVIDVMPLHSALTQSIYSGTGGVYSILVPTQTLLSFLSTTIPVPFLASITVLTGYVSGLSFGSILVILGLIGVVQRAMTLPYETVSETETVFTSKNRYQPEPEEEPLEFATKTDELFYEENQLPRNPLDRMFDDVEVQKHPTQVLREINVSENIPDEPVFDQNLEELSSLTKPISQTLSIDIPEAETVEEEPVQETVEGEGFFVSQFNAERERKNQLEEPEIEVETPEETEPEEIETVEETVEEPSYSHDDLLNALETSPVLEKTLTDELEEAETNAPIFERDENYDISELVGIDEEFEELEQDELETSIELEEAAEKDLTPSIEESVDDLEEDLTESSAESKEDLVKETPAVELTEETVEDKSEKPTDTIDRLEEQKADIILLGAPVEEESETVEETEVEEESTPEESTSEEIFTRLQNGDVDQDLLYEMLTQSDVENLDEIMASEIDMNSIIIENTDDSYQKMNLDEVVEELGQKRGSIQEDERTGYMLTKAYIEMSNRDKSEEKMLDIWSQVAEENRERKLGRRRRASANYQTDNPYSEERERNRQKEIDRIRAEQEEKRWRERKKVEQNTRHQDETAKTVNAQSEDTTLMSEEERIAAGYEKVNFEFSGKTISFWRKKNE